MRDTQPDSLTCPACGSSHVELSVTPPGAKLVDSLKAALTKRSGPGGRRFLICKDCGHVSQLFVL